MGQSSSCIESVQQTNASASRTCPVSHASQSATSSPACPLDSSIARSAQCPVDHGSVNPLNQMPDLSQQRQSHQFIDLPLDRTESSIPRDNASKWEYPSPQQFYNALVRKGWETPEEHVVTMVEIHNFLNEEAWEEVKKWEKRRTEYVLISSVAHGHSHSSSNDDIQLARFKGKPGEMSPKARLHMFAGWLLPSRFR